MSNTRKAGEVTVVGAGGHASVVIATLRDAGHEVTRVVDDDLAKEGEQILDVVIEAVERPSDLTGLAVLAIGDNEKRRGMARRFERFEWVSVVHPTAYVHASVKVGAGSVVFAGSVIQPGVTLGTHVIVNTAVTIDHDCTICDFAHLAPGTHLCGGVRIGQGSLMGVSSCAAPCVGVGEWAMVGAGAAVVSDLPDGVTAIGVPARPTRKVTG